MKISNIPAGKITFPISPHSPFILLTAAVTSGDADVEREDHFPVAVITNIPDRLRPRRIRWREVGFVLLLPG